MGGMACSRTLSLLILVLSLALFACGDDGGDPEIDSGPGGVSDAADGVDGAAGEVDSGTQGGTQGPGQFCETFEDGGPYCETDLECCDDSVCRLPEDCSGSTGFIPCDEGSDCPTSKICCDIPSMTFCTKPSACRDYGGEEIP